MHNNKKYVLGNVRYIYVIYSVTVGNYERIVSLSTPSITWRSLVLIHYGCWFFLLSISELKQYSWSIELFTDVCFPLRIPLSLNQSCWGTTDVEHSSNKSVVGSFIPRRIYDLHQARCQSVVVEFIIWCSMLSIQLE